MAQYQGKVSKIFTSRYGGSFGLEGQHGLYFNTKQALPATIVEGASVAFEATPGRNGKSVYVEDATLKVVSAPAPSNGGGGTSFQSRDDSIRYQSSRKDALAMAALLAAAGCLYNDNTPKAKIAGILEDTVDRFTAVYFEDIENLGALDRVPAPAPQTQAPTTQSLPE
jgi:hypothetical protein